MILNLNTMEEEMFPHFKGGEKEMAAKMFSDGQNRILRGRLVPGASIGMHTHETSSEIIYMLEGCGKIIIDGQEERLEPGMCHYCPKGHTHSLINDSAEDLAFFAVVPEQ